MSVESSKFAGYLDEAAVTKIRALEKEIGACVLALEPRYPVKQLCEEELAKVRKLEDELGVVLLAYRAEACRVR